MVGSGVMDGWVEVGGLLDSFCSMNMERASARLGKDFIQETRDVRGWPGPAPLLPATQSGSFCSGSGLF